MNPGSGSAHPGPGPGTGGRSRRVALVGLTVAAVAVSAQLQLPLPPLPLTLQSFAVAMAGALLAPRDAAAAMGVYLALGALGFPVFAGFAGGPGVFASVKGGFLFGFLAQAVTTSALLRAAATPGRKRPPPSWSASVGAITAGMVALYFVGGLWMVFWIPVTPTKAAQFLAPFSFGAAVKTVLAATLTRRLWPHIPVEPRTV